MAIKQKDVALSPDNVIDLGDIPVRQQYDLVFQISPPHVGLIVPDPTDPTAVAEEAIVIFQIVAGSNTSFLVDREFVSVSLGEVVISIWPNKKGSGHFKIRASCDHPTDPVVVNYRVEFNAVEDEKEKKPHILDKLRHNDLRTKEEKEKAKLDKVTKKLNTKPDPMTLKMLVLSYPGFLVIVAVVLGLTFVISAAFGSCGGTEQYELPATFSTDDNVGDDDGSVEDDDDSSVEIDDDL